MAKFEKPILVELNDISEGVFAAGSGVDTPPPVVTPPPEYPWTLNFCDFDGSGYSTVLFQVKPLNTHKVKKIHIDICFNEGTLCNKLDKLSLVKMSNSGVVSNWTLNSSGNTISLDIDIPKMNETDDVNVKFETKWNHSYVNVQHATHGAYNGLQGHGRYEDIIANGWATATPIFYKR